MQRAADAYLAAFDGIDGERAGHISQTGWCWAQVAGGV